MGCVAQCDFWSNDILQGCPIVSCKLQCLALETSLIFSREPCDIRMGFDSELSGIKISKIPLLQFLVERSRLIPTAAYLRFAAGSVCLRGA